MGRVTVIWCFVLFVSIVSLACDNVSAFSYPKDEYVDCGALFRGCGECVDIDQCGRLLSFLKVQTIPIQDKGDYLNTLHCGWSDMFIPRVCCECQ